MKLENLVRSFKLIWTQAKFWVIITAISSIILGFFPLLSVWVVKELVNSITSIVNGSGNIRIPLILLLIQFGLIVFGSIIKNIQDYYNQKVAIKVDYIVKLQISNKLNTVPYTYFDIPKFYDQVDRIENNSGSRFLSPINSLFSAIESLISIFSLLFFLFSIHWSLGLISVLSMVPIIFVRSYFGNQKFWLNYFLTPLAREAGYLQRLLIDRDHAKEVKMFNLSNYLISKWKKKFWSNASETIKLMKRSKKADVGLDGVTALFYTVAAGIVIWLVYGGKVKIGEFVAIGQAIKSTQESVGQLSSSLASIYEDSLYINDYYTFVDFDDPTFKKTKGEKLFTGVLSQGISCENLAFSYPNSEENVLDDISFRIASGEKVAIIGDNGSGKTTLVKCLLGLYPATKGNIFYDNNNINEFDQVSFREKITVIFQDFIRYAFTVKENIGISNVSNMDDYKKIITTAKKVNLHMDIAALKDEYSTVLGRFLQEGTDLSGGQWQKVALSRALFKDSEIIFLDEPTAALDPLTEIEIFNQFKQIAEGKTAFFISHRMAVGRLVDKIIVLDKGRIVEFGNHEQLLAMNGKYATMYNSQSDWATGKNKEFQTAGV
ncbi:ABC transporter ATP-binding protein [Rossellomorea marisflavi]|uniref:ABC transporter ATP-binding protein n=1 Tax=Rossellomorea marisflavi TaxID=189381 RepID=UPI003512C570